MNPIMLFTRTYSGDYRRIVAIASYRHASGHVFLIHRSLDNRDKWSCTYAPIGMHAGAYDTIAEAIERIERISCDEVERILRPNIERLTSEYHPLFSGENGIPGTWQDREQWRMDNGDYTPIPWLDSLRGNGYVIPESHYAHVSTKTDEMIAYTPSDEKGNRDIQVRLKLGKYLKKTFDGIPDSIIQSAVVEYRAKVSKQETETTLEFTTSRDTINDIFETEMSACNSGMTSCMYDKFTDWEDRPYHVYADSPDVAVAYMVRDGDIMARSVVSVKDQSYVRLYSRGGCETLCAQLRELLQDAGYSHGSLEGNRLTRLPRRHGNDVLPYLDGGAQNVTRDGKYWRVVDSDGEYECCNTDGTADTVNKCERCGNHNDDCECSYCQCCDESYYGDECDNCNICEHCENCRTHARRGHSCDCHICENCDRLVDGGRYSCHCDRCGECNELEENCDCDLCGTCNRLAENCECSSEEEEIPDVLTYAHVGVTLERTTAE